MENNQKQNLWKYLLFGGVLGVSYWLVQYLSKAAKAKAKPLSLQQTSRILREIKYQMLTVTISFAEAVSTKKVGKNAEDMEIVFRTDMAKVCEHREQAVLGKYDLSRQQYAASLEEYKKNPKVQQAQLEIIEMMERAIKGRIPDMTIPRQATLLVENANPSQLYVEMCEMIAIRMWEALEDNKKRNPGFNSRDQLHYKKAMKEINIFDCKCKFLEQKGFQQAWGNPNQVFFKALETLKQKDNNFKAEMTKVEKAFDKTIQSVTLEPENYNPERIKFFFEENINNSIAEAMKPKAPVPPPAVSRSMGAPPVKKSANDQVDMEALMMQELLSRSAEEPKAEQEKKPEEPKPVVEEKKEEQAKVEKEEKAEQKQVEISEEKPEEVSQEKPEENQKAKEDEPAPVENKPQNVEVSEEKKEEPVEEKKEEPVEEKKEEPVEEKKEQVEEKNEQQKAPESKEEKAVQPEAQKQAEKVEQKAEQQKQASNQTEEAGRSE